AYGGATFNTFFPGDIGEILVYSRTLPDAERRAAEAYLIRRWSLPGAEKLSKLDAKRAVKEAAAAEAARRRDAFERLLDEIDPLAQNGDFAAARKRLEKAKAQPQFAANAEKIDAALRVCKVLEDRAKAAAAGAKALVGTEVELRARRGRRRGEVKQVTDAGIVLVTKYKIGAKEFEKPVTVGWPTLAPDQVDEFAGKGGWKTAGPDGAVARAYLALGRKDNDGATKALAQAGDHPLAVHLRRKLGAPAAKVTAKTSAIPVPGGWPRNRKGLVFAWEAAGKPVILMNPATGRAHPCPLRVRGKAKMAADGSMQLDKGAYLLEGADKLLLAACKATNALTIETSMLPKDLKQDGPARIISFSQDAQNRNFTLGQSGGKLGLRLRTPLTGVNGSKPESTLCDLPKAGPCHVIVSYSPGRLVCYLNGRKVLETDKVQGDFSNWEPMHFLLGDEWKDSRDWAGTLRGIAIYNRFMSEAEAASSFRNSPRPRAVPAAAKTKKWKSIFNGEDMTGWTKYGGKAYVEEGALVADNEADLFHKAAWSEFVLDFETRGKAFGLNLAHAKAGRGAPHRVGLVFHKDGDLHVRRDGKRLWKSGGDKFRLKEWTPVRLALSKGGLKIYRGEKLIGKVDLPRAERKGGIYFYSHGGKAMIRKVRVRLPESGT
ncbi:MAG: family 16 glycoside hydrolase, partial [Planctomycetota bacterium]